MFSRVLAKWPSGAGQARVAVCRCHGQFASFATTAGQEPSHRDTGVASTAACPPRRWCSAWSAVAQAQNLGLGDHLVATQQDWPQRTPLDTPRVLLAVDPDMSGALAVLQMRALLATGPEAVPEDPAAHVRAAFLSISYRPVTLQHSFSATLCASWALLAASYTVALYLVKPARVVCQMQAAHFASTVTVDRSTLYDMPVTHYTLASGRRKRRVDVARLCSILQAATRVAAGAGAALEVVLERPTPIPDLDGWQSAATSGAGPAFQATAHAQIWLQRLVYSVLQRAFICWPR